MWKEENDFHSFVLSDRMVTCFKKNVMKQCIYPVMAEGNAIRPKPRKLIVTIVLLHTVGMERQAGHMYKFIQVLTR